MNERDSSNASEGVDGTEAVHETPAPAAHTPGPWTAERRGQDWHVFTEAVRSKDCGGRHTVAMPMDGTPEQCAANARLIAAAPALLEALKFASKVIAQLAKDEDVPAGRILACSTDISAAIALAEGRRHEA